MVDVEAPPPKRAVGSKATKFVSNRFGELKQGHWTVGGNGSLRAHTTSAGVVGERTGFPLHSTHPQKPSRGEYQERIIL